MKKTVLKDISLTVSILVLTFVFCLILREVFEIGEQVTAIFVFAVFLVSLLTDGYTYGLIASVLGTTAVNYAFTFPYFAINFTIHENIISAIVMITVAMLTCMLTAQIKKHEALKTETEKEHMRANLLRAVSHDLRTPLTTIYGSVTTLIDDESMLTEEQRSKMLVDIKNDSDWLIRMVENLLSVTKIDSGEVKIIKTPTALDELIDSVIVKFKKRYPTQPVTLDIPESLVMIPMDAILIEQVLVNILENAVRHAEGMTELRLKVFTLGKTAIFEIADNGCGIRNEILPKLFGGYFDTTPTPADSKKRNAGIGLSVCATIIKAHGGDIKAENAKEGGAVFRFTLATEEDIDEQQI
ncbi:MAG: PAS domain-containing sensor histidine kinase [Clostridia bacterium]|nr:PAS domain-containing sensor histidine kinase [Clostridia bacterium]